jgi:uncharacterized membrane protein
VSERRLTGAIIVLSVAGLGVAGYLTYVHYAGLHPVCVASGGCETVQSSHYAKLAGIPVPLLGLIGYASILGSLLVPDDTGRMATAGLAVVGFGFSLYLTYLELFVIKAICQWCVASAVLMTALAILAVIRLLRAPPVQAA